MIKVYDDNEGGGLRRSDEILKEARKLIKARRFDGALEILLSSCPGEDDSIDVRCLVFDCFLAKKRYDESLVTAIGIREKFPGSEEGYWREIRSLLLLKRYAIAEDAVKHINIRFPQSFRGLLVSNDYYRSVGYIDEAIRCSEMIVSLAEDAPDGYIRLAQDLVLKNELSKAISVINRGVVACGELFSLLIAGNDICRASGELDLALNYAERLVDLFPKKSDGFRRTVQGLLALQRFDDAKSINDDFLKSRNKMSKVEVSALARGLFDNTDRFFYSHVRGRTDSRFLYLSAHHKKIYDYVLKIIESSGIRYYLFAASAISVVRKWDDMPWLDDLDIMVMEEDADRFNSEVLERFRSAGIQCLRSVNSQGLRGVQILVDGDKSHKKFDLVGDVECIVPTIQIDVFYSYIENGVIKNRGGWGLYHKVSTPAHFLGDGCFVEYFGKKRRFFSCLHEDVLYEYGDVCSELSIGSHGKMLIRSALLDVDFFRCELEEIIGESKLVTSGWARNYEETNPKRDVYIIEGGVLYDVLDSISKLAPRLIIIDCSDHLIFIPDIVGIFPGIKISVVMSEIESMLDLYWFAYVYFENDVYIENDSLRLKCEEIEQCLLGG